MKIQIQFLCVPIALVLFVIYVVLNIIFGSLQSEDTPLSGKNDSAFIGDKKYSREIGERNTKQENGSNTGIIYKSNHLLDKDQYFFIERLEEAANFASEDDKIENTFRLLNEWATQDIKSALEWLSSRDSIESSGDYYHAVFIAAMANASNKDDIASLILELPSNLSSKGRIINDYVEHLTSRDPWGAMDWSNNISEVALKNHAQHIVVHEWSVDSPDDVLNYLSTYPNISDELNRYATNVAARRLINRSPNLSADLIYQYPESIRLEFAQSVVRQLVDDNANTNNHNAKRWVQSLPEGDIKDKALFQYIESSGIETPLAETFQLVMDINDSDTRDQVLISSFENWYIQNPKVAEQILINSHLLGDEQKEQMLEKVKSDFAQSKNT